MSEKNNRQQAAEHPSTAVTNVIKKREVHFLSCNQFRLRGGKRFK
jgi:hypothetical protein